MEHLDPSTPFITNGEIARVLFQVASMLEVMEANPYRTRAYRRAALSVLFLPKPLIEYFGRQEEPPLTGVGERIRGRITELVNTGHMGTYEALLDELGEPMLTLLSIAGVGPKTAVRLISELGISGLEDLADAARDGKIRALHGFGPKRESALLVGAEERLHRAA